MQNFIYNTPTKVYFGKDTHKQVGDIIKEYGYKKIMIQYGQGSIKKSGLYDQITDALNLAGIEYVEKSGVEPNPKIEFVRKAVEIAKREKVDFILAVGGGSVLDSCKFTALGAKSEYDVWDLVMNPKNITDALPVGVVLTHSAAGSEMSNSAVISNLELNMKKGVSTELNRCKFAICNPDLTYTVSKYQTACGIVDMMTHTIERYFSVKGDTLLTDEVAEGILRSIITAGKVAINNPYDYEARATLMWGSSIAHNGLTGCGRLNYLAVHQLEHAISGEYDQVAHGAGLAVLFPAWGRYIYKHDISRFARFARKVWGVVEDDDNKCALQGIDKMAEYFESLGMPTKLRDFNIPKDAITRLANLCTYGKTRTINSCIQLGYDEIVEIFELCY